jgi:putative membrane protein|tara:strand:- start:259 stop:624 length:366 start_codon:yes stop_codon:yes gene_type:complete
MSFVLRIIANSIAVVISAWFLDGVQLDGFMTAIIVALVLAFLNSIVKPVLILLTIPVTVVTLGLFLLVINAIIIIIAAYAVTGFSVDGFWSALFFSFILSFLNSIFLGRDKEKRNESNELN